MPCYARDGKLKPEEIAILADWIDPLQQNFSFMYLIHLWGFTFLPLK